MALIKILFKTIFFLLFFAFLVITCFVIYIQGTKPAVPSFEQVKSDFSILLENEQHQPCEWTPFEEFPPALPLFLSQATNNNSRNSPLLESISSSFCIPAIQEGSRPFFSSRYSLANHILLRGLMGLYDFPIRGNPRNKSFLGILYSCTLTTDLWHQWGDNRVIEAFFNLDFYGQRIYGINAASHFYFEKNPNQLNLQESVILLGLLEAPTRYSIAPEELAASSCRTLNRLPLSEQEKNCDTLKPYIETFFNYRTRITPPVSQQIDQTL